MAKVGKPKLPKSEQKVPICVTVYYKHSQRETFLEKETEYDAIKEEAREFLRKKLNKLINVRG
jgi:hypothetical protein